MKNKITAILLTAEAWLFSFSLNCEIKKETDFNAFEVLRLFENDTSGLGAPSTSSIDNAVLACMIFGLAIDLLPLLFKHDSKNVLHRLEIAGGIIAVVIISRLVGHGTIMNTSQKLTGQ